MLPNATQHLDGAAVEIFPMEAPKLRRHLTSGLRAPSPQKSHRHRQFFGGAGCMCVMVKDHVLHWRMYPKQDNVDLC
ncbi:hypothetical protein PCASD_03990 [Puccinia coronata f. sp. avenae]|uniref:Uncharacterized protein n=1 Tax=Puccinia coronata f. sp. avenae TaxID=200324 RepID=A0A2N5V5J3_9BASI|nr:hypothetical protein PCASD_03990 [Puccinia coronata f. sp. avenae]